MLSQLARVSQCVVPCRRLLLCRQVALRFSSTQAFDANSKQPKKRLRTALIRTWKPVNNVAETWAILSELERRYGQVLESHFLKDFEATNRYQMLSMVVFASPESLERVPENGIELTIPALPISRLPHEISMDDLEQITLQSQESAEANTEMPVEDSTNKPDVIGFRVSRSEKDYTELSNVMMRENRIFQLTPKSTMERFYSWGGFSKLEPMESKPYFTNDNLFSESDVDHPRMRAALQLCAMNLKQLPKRISHVRDQPPKATKTIPAPEQADVSSLSQSKQSSTTDIPTDTSPPEGFVPEISEPIPPLNAEESPLPSEPVPSSNPPASTVADLPPLPKKPTRTPEEEKAYEQQMKFARSLRTKIKTPAPRPPIPMTTTSTRRKQAKPQIKSSSRKSRSSQVEGTSAEPAQAQTGVLSKLWGLLGKR